MSKPRTKEENRIYMREYMRRKRNSNITSNDLDVKSIIITFFYSLVKYNLVADELRETSFETLCDLYDVKTDFTKWSKIYSINATTIANFFKTQNLPISAYKIRTTLSYLRNHNLCHKAGELYIDANRYVYLYQFNKDIQSMIDKDYENIGWEYIKYLQNKPTTSNKEKRLTVIVNTFPELINKYTNEYTHFLETQKDGTVRYIRYFTELCKTKNPDNHEDRPLERYYELDKLYGFEHLDEYAAYKEKYIDLDISAMSLRTTKNIILSLQGKPLEPINIDEYEVIYNDMESTFPIDNFHNSEERKLIKVELQSLVQKPNAVKTKIQIFEEFRNKDIDMNHITLDYLNTIALVERGKQIEKVFSISYSKFLYELKDALYRFCKIDTNQRFMLLSYYYFVEGLVYGEMMEYFKLKEIKVFNVFDGFYGLRSEFTEEDLYKAYEYGIKQAVLILGKDFIYKNFVKTYEYVKQKTKPNKYQHVMEYVNSYNYGNEQIKTKFINYVKERKIYSTNLAMQMLKCLTNVPIDYQLDYIGKLEEKQYLYMEHFTPKKKSYSDINSAETIQIISESYTPEELTKLKDLASTVGYF